MEGSVNLNIVFSNQYIINAIVTSDNAAEPWKLLAIYRPLNLSNQAMFWDFLNTIAQNFQGPWFVCGDFNMVFTQANKKEGTPMGNSSNGGYARMINDLGWIDIGFSGSPYTWNNRRRGAANIMERLDRGFTNNEWKVQFQ